MLPDVPTFFSYEPLRHVNTSAGRSSYCNDVQSVLYRVLVGRNGFRIALPVGCVSLGPTTHMK